MTPTTERPLIVILWLWLAVMLVLIGWWVWHPTAPESADTAIVASQTSGTVYMRVHALAEEIEHEDPLTAASLFAIAASVVMDDQARVAMLLREYSRRALDEIQQRKGMVRP